MKVPKKKPEQPDGTCFSVSQRLGEYNGEELGVDDGEVIFELLDQMTPDEIRELKTVYLVHWGREKIPPQWVPIMTESLLEMALEGLDTNCELGNPDDPTEATENMHEAMSRAVEVIADEYVPWSCRPLYYEEIDVQSWVGHDDEDVWE